MGRRETGRASGAMGPERRWRQKSGRRPKVHDIMRGTDLVLKRLKGNQNMTEEGKEKVKAAAVAGVGAGVGGAGGASAGVLELAALGTAVTEVSAGLVIAAGAAAGAAVFLAGWGLYRFLKKSKPETAATRSTKRKTSPAASSVPRPGGKA